MIFHPVIIALLAGSGFVVFMVFYSAAAAVGILRRWDPASGSERQLVLERKTYLVSTLLAYAFGFELVSFFLYIYAADRLHTFFVGAMCAAGTLYVNAYGYPALLAKLVTFLAAGVWLIVNHVDNRAEDYPLVRKKYAFFLALVPLVLLETFLQASYFLRLKPDIITSCCGTLFSTDGGGLWAGPGAVPRVPAMAAFYGIVLATCATGFLYARKGGRGYLFSALVAASCAVSVISMFSFISAYIYESPSHHCPFCMLQGEYGYVGYPLYLALLGGTITGLGVGILSPFRKVPSLSSTLPATQRRLALAASILFLLFAAIVTLEVLLSNLKY